MKIRILLLFLLTWSALARPLSDTSLYNLPSQWTDQSGKSMVLPDLRGQVRVLAMIYTNCQSTCPAIIHAMQDTEAQLTPSQRGRVGFVLVSIDPAVDTPEQLQDFAQEHHFGPAWRLLRGNQEDVRELAAVLNFKYRKTSQKDYAHSAMITVLDREGEVVHQQVGLSGGAQERLSALRRLLP